MRPRHRTLLLGVLAVLSVGGDRALAAPHEGDMIVGSTAASGGSLAVRFAFPSTVLVSESFSAGGISLFSATNPGFDAESVDQPGGGSHVLPGGVAVSVEIVSIEPGVAVKFAGGTIDAPGESVPLGRSPDLHVHPEWQLTVPTGTVAERHLSFRLVPGTPGFSPSGVYSLTVANGVVSPAPTPRPTATPAPTGPVTPAPGGPEPTTLSRPRGTGDELFAYFDARTSFTTFLNLRNEGPVSIRVRVRFHGPDLAALLDRELEIAAGGTRTVDVGELREMGLPAVVGLARVVAIGPSGNPLVSRALSGSFTIANLATSSAWGAAAPARLALGSGGTLPAVGTPLGVGGPSLQAVHPETAGLAVYYDPDSLPPADQGGNQLIFVSFDDAPDGSVVAAATEWLLEASRNDGSPIVAAPLVVRGVQISDLESVLGSGVRGASGGVRFSAQGGAHNRLVWFAEALGTFGTGYLLPPH